MWINVLDCDGQNIEIYSKDWVSIGSACYERKTQPNGLVRSSEGLIMPRICVKMISLHFFQS